MKKFLQKGISGGNRKFGFTHIKRRRRKFWCNQPHGFALLFRLINITKFQVLTNFPSLIQSIEQTRDATRKFLDQFSDKRPSNDTRKKGESKMRLQKKLTKIIKEELEAVLNEDNQRTVFSYKQ